MSEVAILREEFERKVKELQDSCPHEEVTDWYNVYWAIGHPSLYEQRTCKRCDKIMERRSLKIVDEFKEWAEEIPPSRLKHRRRDDMTEINKIVMRDPKQPLPLCPRCNHRHTLQPPKYLMDKCPYCNCPLHYDLLEEEYVL